MKGIKSIIKKKGRNLVILSTLLLLLDLFLFICFDTDNSMSGLLKDKCIINSVEDIQKCKKENPYVKINFDAVYNTTYVYQLDEKIVAYYLDIDLDGKSLISLVDKEIAPKLLNGKQKYVEGKLIEFSDVHLDALEQIKKYYASEGIEVTYIDAHFSNYNIDGDAICLVILLIFTGFILFKFSKGIYMIVKPENNHYYKKYKEEIESLDRELNSEYRYHSKNVIITDNYIFNQTKYNLKIYRLEDVKWVYQKNIKRYGINIHKSIVINFVDGKNIIIPFKQKDVLDHLKNDVLVGYTGENSKKYREIVKEYKISHK